MFSENCRVDETELSFQLEQAELEQCKQKNVYQETEQDLGISI